MQKSIDAKLQVLEAFEALYAVDNEISADEFMKFSVATLTHHDDIQALQWIPYVPLEGLAAFEELGRGLYGPGFFVTERNEAGELIPVTPRPYYFPILYTEPAAGNELIIGLDAAFEPSRRAVVEAAWYGGSPTVSSPIQLVQESGDQMAVLIYQPIYTTSRTPVSLDERSSGILGLIPVVLRTGDFLTASLADYDASGFTITVTDADEPSAMLYQSATATGSPDSTEFSS